MQKQNLPNYQYATKRIFPDLGAHGLEREFNIRGLLILHPFVQVMTGENDVIEQPPSLCDFSLEAWLVQVLDTAKTSILHLFVI